MIHCSVDIETFSKVNLKTAGTYRYAEHESTRINCFCYRFGNDGPVHLWYPFAKIPKAARPRADKLDKGSKVYIQTEMPDDLFDHILEGGELRAWNAMFERVVLNGSAGKKIGWPEIPVEQWTCTMTKAMAHGLPAALGNCAAECQTHPKDETGKQPMLQLAKPRKPSKNDPDEEWYIERHPDKWQNLFHYCMDDVRAESALDVYIPDLRGREQKAYWLDQKINDRGIRVDMEGVRNAIHLVAKYKEELKTKLKELIGLTPGQTEKLGNWVRERYKITDLQAETVKKALKDATCPDLVKKVLKIYSTHGMKAPTKYNAMERAICLDGRLHGMFLFNGAATGRWSSRIVQLQNLFRPLKEIAKEVDDVIEAMTLRSLGWIRSLWALNPMKVFSSCVRGMLIASVNCRLMCLDFSQIEARVIAWLAGQEDLVDVFRSGLDVYKVTAAKIYGIDIDDVDDDQRFIGKIAVLALGYQGGWRAFVKMAKQFGVDGMDPIFADKIKDDWRRANKMIVALWYSMEEAAIAAVANPGKMYAGAPHKRILFKVQGDWLYMRLPSGRNLAYYKPRLNSDGQVTFMGVDTYTRQWTRCKTYGGKLVENAVQAIARDLLLHGMFNLEAADYNINGTVHDEVIMDLENGFGTLEEAGELMCDLPDWAGDLPVTADGFEAQRYRK